MMTCTLLVLQDENTTKSSNFLMDEVYTAIKNRKGSCFVTGNESAYQKLPQSLIDLMYDKERLPTEETLKHHLTHFDEVFFIYGDHFTQFVRKVRH